MTRRAPSVPDGGWTLDEVAKNAHHTVGSESIDEVNRRKGETAHA